MCCEPTRLQRGCFVRVIHNQRTAGSDKPAVHCHKRFRQPHSPDRKNEGFIIMRDIASSVWLGSRLVCALVVKSNKP